VLVLASICAYVGLLVFDVLSLAGFTLQHRLVRGCPRLSRTPDARTVARLCRAVDEACVWYPKQVFCFQRSAVATCLLRLRGVPAQLVIGYRPVPLDSHAWVEVDRQVVNDRPQYQKFFLVLDRL
jgi:hypothetical protein